jgi:galactokinase
MLQVNPKSDRFQGEHRSAVNLPDLTVFLKLLENLNDHPVPEARNLFEPGEELFVTRAPGRLDLMGGIADYSGSLVLELPIAEAAFVALQRDSERKLRIVSVTSDPEREAAFEMPLDCVAAQDALPDYDAARLMFESEPRRHWASYIAGCFLVLMCERGVRFASGARILLASNVPEGKGVSSSAAIEVAAMSAITAAFGVDLTPPELGLLCQKVENAIVGAPCGVMDQMTAACGVAGELFALRCQPAELLGSIALPGDLSVWGVDSGVRHSIRGADYASVRTGAFMGYRIIADLAQLPVHQDGETVRIEDHLWHGYLANVTPAEFEEKFAASIPEEISGKEFLDLYIGTSDQVTRVDPERTYAVLKPTAHPIYEHARVRKFAEVLPAQRHRRNELLGELMYQSHASYSACGLGAPGTDQLVDLVKELGPDEGLFGAKVTGGGSGGTVAILGRRDAAAAVERVAQRYADVTGLRPHVFSGSSFGRAAFGVRVIKAPPPRG